MVRYTHPEMFYLFIPLTLVLIWYAYQGRKLRMGLEALGTSSVKKFLLNRVKHSNIRLRSRLIILGIIFILLASGGPQIGLKLKALSRIIPINPRSGSSGEAIIDTGNVISCPSLSIVTSTVCPGFRSTF